MGKGGILGRGGLLDDISKGARDFNRTSNSIYSAKRSIQRTALDVTTTPYQWHTGVNRAHATANRSEASVNNSEASIYRSQTNAMRAQDQRDEYMNNRNANQGHFGAGTRPVVGGIPANNNVPQVLDVSKKDQARYDELRQVDAKLMAADLNHNGQVDPNEMTSDVKKMMKEADKLARKIGDDDLAKMNSYYAQQAANDPEYQQQGVEQLNSNAATKAFGQAMREANLAQAKGDMDARAVAIAKAEQQLKALKDEHGNLTLDQQEMAEILGDNKATPAKSPVALMAQVSKAYAKKDEGTAIPEADIRIDHVTLQTGKVPVKEAAASAHPVKDFSDAMVEANKATTDDARKGALGRAAIALKTLDGDKSKFNLNELDPAIKAAIMKDMGAAMALANDPNALIRKASEALAEAKVGTVVAQADIDTVVKAVREGKPVTGKAPDTGVDGTGHTSEPATPATGEKSQASTFPGYNAGQQAVLTRTAKATLGDTAISTDQVKALQDMLVASGSPEGKALEAKMGEGKAGHGVFGPATTKAFTTALASAGLTIEDVKLGKIDFTKPDSPEYKKFMDILQTKTGASTVAPVVANTPEKTETPAPVKTEATGLAKLTPEQTKALQTDLVKAGLLTEEQANGKWDETQVNALRTKIQKLNDVGKYAAHDSRGYAHIDVEAFLKDPTQRVEQTSSHIGEGSHYSQPMIDTLLANGANKVEVKRDLLKEYGRVVANEKKVPDYVVVDGVEQARPDLPSDAIWTDSKGNKHGGLDGQGGQNHSQRKHQEDVVYDAGKPAPDELGGKMPTAAEKLKMHQEEVVYDAGKPAPDAVTKNAATPAENPEFRGRFTNIPEKQAAVAPKLETLSASTKPGLEETATAVQESEKQSLKKLVNADGDIVITSTRERAKDDVVSYEHQIKGNTQKAYEDFSDKIAESLNTKAVNGVIAQKDIKGDKLLEAAATLDGKEGLSKAEVASMMAALDGADTRSMGLHVDHTVNGINNAYENVDDLKSNAEKIYKASYNLPPVKEKDTALSSNLLHEISSQLPVGQDAARKGKDVQAYMENVMEVNNLETRQNGELTKGELVTALNSGNKAFAPTDSKKFDELLAENNIERTANGYAVKDTAEASQQSVGSKARGVELQH